MPSALPCSLTQTADGRDLYVENNQGAPVGTVVYFNSVAAVGGNIFEVVPFNAIYPNPIFNPGVPAPNGLGQGVPIPPGVYLFRLSVPAVGASFTGLTKACFTGTWDGIQLVAGAAASSNNFTSTSAYIGTATNPGGVANVLVWAFTGIATTLNTAQIEVVLLQKLPYILPLV